MKAYIKEQTQRKQEQWDNYYKGNYTKATPLVCVDLFGVAPLTAVLIFEDSDATRYKVVLEDGCYTWTQSNTLTNWVEVVGLKAGRVNSIQLMGYKDETCMFKTTVSIETKPLPKHYEALDIAVLEKNKKATNWIGLNLAATKGRAPQHNLCTIIDGQGEVRWYYTERGWNLLKQLKNGNIIIDAPQRIEGTPRYIPVGFIEITLTGEVKAFYEVPNGLHHDVCELPNENFWVLTQSDDSVEDLVVEIHRETKQVVQRYDFREILDQSRKPGIDKEFVNDSRDWLHLNSVSYDANDGGMIVSSRNQNIVVKINPVTKEIVWILGSHDNFTEKYRPYLLHAKGKEFEWSWAQHSAFIDQEGLLYVFDNGNFRSYQLENAKLAYENYSRGVIYQIDEINKTVTQKWEYGKSRKNELKCPYLGSIALQNNGNLLICFGGITRDRFGNPIDDLLTPLLKTSAHIIEVETTTQEVVFELIIQNINKVTEDGYVCYRAEAVYPVQ